MGNKNETFFQKDSRAADNNSMAHNRICISHIRHRKTDGKSKRMGREVMIIHTERMILKPLGTEYLQTVNKYATDLENTRFMMHLPNENIEETKAFLEGTAAEWQKETPTFYEFAIILDGVHIGAVSVYMDESFSEGELGWIVDKDYWGKGYAYEASKALVDMYVEKLGIRKFIAHCDSENEASKRVMQKLGMQLEAEYDGRKNRASDEVRRECLYSMEVR